MTKLLYFESLNEHMKKYMNDVKLSDINDSLQAQKIKLLRQIELSNISQAEAANKLEELKKVATVLNSNEVTSFSKTAAPDLKQSIPSEEYSPITVARYETIIKNRSKVLPSGLIDELKKKLQTREVKNDMLDKIEVKSVMNNMLNNVNNQSSLMRDLKSELERRKEVKNNMSGIVNDLINRSVNTSESKNTQNRSTKTSKKAKTSKKTIASSTTASTTSSAADMSQISDKLNFNEQKASAKRALIDKGYSEEQAKQKLEGIRSNLELNRMLSGSGLNSRNFRSKRIL